MGIKMGEPLYKFHNLYKEGKVEVFSSNFNLYSNMSWRVMEILKSICPLVEVYSVDEAFLDLSHINRCELINIATELKYKIKQWTGIPVSIGIASTKTLAKIANYLAKGQSGLVNLFDCPNLDEILDNVPIEEIWGIGRKLAPRFRMLGIGDLKALRDSDADFIRKRFSIMEEKIVYELRGNSCIDLVVLQKKKKSISYSRSFGTSISELEELEKALSDYASKASEKLRRQNSRTSAICVYIRTNYYNLKQPQYNNSIYITMPYPSSNTAEIIIHSKKALHKIYKPGYLYHKIGIILSDLVSNKLEQIELFESPNYIKI